MHELESEVDAILGELDGDYIGGFFGKLIKSVKSVVKNPVVREVAGTAAIVYPPVGIPLAGGLAVADRVIDVEEGLRGGPKAQQQARAALAHTAHLAKQGHPDAKRTMLFIDGARQMRELERKSKGAQRGILITDAGHVVRGVWSRS